MRRNVIAGIGASAATVAASIITSIALAAAILQPLAAKQPNNDVMLTWRPETSIKVASYSVIECAYLSQPDAKCKTIGQYSHNAAYTDYSVTIAASDVLTATGTTFKVSSLDAAGVQIRREHAEPFTPGAPTEPPTNPTPQPTQPPTSGSSEVFKLADGCQENIAVGVMPDKEFFIRVVEAGGQVRIDDVGVYQLTLTKYGVHEDDKGLVDVRDFENECRMYNALIAR